jgi:hypothetical protein
MSVHITNVSSGLLSVQLNSGRTVHLAPRERSGEIEPYEVDENHWVRRLSDQGWLAVEESADEPDRGRRRARSGTHDDPAPAN